MDFDLNDLGADEHLDDVLEALIQYAERIGLLDSKKPATQPYYYFLEE